MEEKPQRLKYRDVTTGLGSTLNANHWIQGEYAWKNTCLCPVYILYIFAVSCCQERAYWISMEVLMVLGFMFQQFQQANVSAGSSASS